MPVKPVRNDPKNYGAKAKGDKPKNEPNKPGEAKDGYSRACAVNLVAEWGKRTGPEAVVNLSRCYAVRLTCNENGQWGKDCSYTVSVDGGKPFSYMWSVREKVEEKTIPSSAPGKQSRFEIKIQGVR